MSECSKLLFKLYTWSTSKQRHTSFQSTVAGQLCVQLTEDKSQKWTEWDQCVSKLSAELKLLHIGTCEPNPRLLACFLHGHNVKHIFSELLACREPREPGNSWWRRIKCGTGEWSRMGRAASWAGEKRYIPAAWRTGRKIPTTQETN